MLSGRLVRSSDGISCTGSASGDAAFAGNLGRCNAVAYGNSLWVAGGGGNAHNIATSSDGISWTGSTSGDLAFAGGTCNAVAYNGNSLWVAGGSYDSAHKIAYSSDGISWTGSTSGDAAFAGSYGACRAVAFGETYIPTPTPPPPPGPGVAYIPSVASSFNIFRTNFSGMGNLGEYY